MCAFKFNPARVGEIGEGDDCEVVSLPEHAERLTARLTQRSAEYLCEYTQEFLPRDRDDTLHLHVYGEFNDPGGGGIVRAQFAARYKASRSYMWFPESVGVTAPYASVFFSTDARQAIAGNSRGNVVVQIGALALSAPLGYAAFGVCLPADMLSRIRVSVLRGEERVSGCDPIVRGWVQFTSIVKEFPSVRSRYYDAFFGVTLSGVLTPPRYDTDYVDVEGYSLLRACWPCDNHAVVVFSQFNVLVVGSLEINVVPWSEEISFKLCVKGGATRTVYFDVAGASDAPYTGTTYVSEVCGLYSGRAQCVGVSIPYANAACDDGWSPRF